MKQKLINSFLAWVVLIHTCGCEDTRSNQVGGGLVGGATGAIVGAQIGSGTGQLIGVATGTLLGALLGSEIGRHIAHSDHAYADEAAQKAFRTGKPTTWRNPSTAHKGSIKAGAPYWDHGECCRPYTQKIYIGNKEVIAHGTACQQADGTWVICD